MAENAESSDRVKTQGATGVIGQVIENIGAHGIPNIKRAKNTYRKCFWLLVFLGGLAAFLTHCIASVQAYLAHEVTVNLDIGFKKKYPFPAVTVCNLNPVKSSLLNNFFDLCELLDSSGACMTDSPPNTSSQSGLIPTTNRYQDWHNIDFGAMDSRHSLIHKTADIIGAMDYTKRQRTGHTIEDMLLSCTFQGFPCGPTNFTWFYNYQYGNCYTFNSGESRQPVEVSAAGPLNGLTMSLYIEQAEYISEIQGGAGVRVDIHPQNKMPFPEDEGVNAGPGTEAFIGIKKTFIERKSSPFTNCTVETNNTIFSQYFTQVEYSKLMCEKNCYYVEVLKTCGCAAVRYRYDDSTVACNSSDPVTGSCINGVEARYVRGHIPCNCTFACREDVFKPTVSYSLWPNDKFKPVVQEGIRAISDSLKNSIDNDNEFVENNVVKVNVFFEELTYDYIYHTETYGSYALLSDIGGNVGLWIGISVLTVVEILELAYDIIVLCLAKGRSAGERSPSEQKGMNSSDVELDPALHASSSFNDKMLPKKLRALPSRQSQEPWHLYPEFSMRVNQQFYPAVQTKQRPKRDKSKRSSSPRQSYPLNLPQTAASDFHPQTFDSARVVYNPRYTDYSTHNWSSAWAVNTNGHI